MRALITGVTGFIGSHLAELLLRSGDHVLGTAQRSWRVDAPDSLVQAVPLLDWDVREPAPKDVVRKIERFCPDVVFHFAAISIPALCGKDTPTEHALSVNVGGTGHLLDLVQTLDTHPRVVFASTCHVYQRVDGNNPVVHEQSPVAPISGYGQTKLQCEETILRRVQEQGLDTVIARGFHHVGPRQPRGLMLTDWLAQLRDPNCSTIRVRCTSSFLDLIDVRDAAAAYRILAISGTAGDIYNLGSGQITKSGEVLGVILSQIAPEVTVSVETVDAQWNAIADIGKISTLGWSPKVPITNTIRDMLAGENA